MAIVSNKISIIFDIYDVVFTFKYHFNLGRVSFNSILLFDLFFIFGKTFCSNRGGSRSAAEFVEESYTRSILQQRFQVFANFNS